MGNGNKPVPQPGRQPAPAAQGANLAELLQLLGPMRQQEQANMAAMAREGDKSRPRPAIQGEMRGQGLGNPATTGLTGLYANNPDMRVGEYDPTGAKHNRRRNLGYAREDALADLQFRNEYAQGLMDLHRKMGGQQGAGADEAGRGDPMVNPAAGGMMEHNVFDTLFPTETREERRFAQADAEQAARAAYERATGRNLQEGEALPPRWFRFRPGESPREQMGQQERDMFYPWREEMKEHPAGQTMTVGFYQPGEEPGGGQPGDLQFPMTESQWAATPGDVRNAIMAQADAAGIKNFAAYIVPDDAHGFHMGQWSTNNPDLSRFTIRPSEVQSPNPMSRWTDMQQRK